MTVFGIFFFLFSAILGAIALDISSIYEERTQLQVNSDSAAHAALYNVLVIGRSEDDARTEAIELIRGAVPEDGNTIVADDIEFGVWNKSTRAFSVDEIEDGAASADGSLVWAARVVAKRNTALGNAVPTFLFRLIGRDSFNMDVLAVFAQNDGTECSSNDGFFTAAQFDAQPDTTIAPSVCVVANEVLRFASNDVTVTGATILCSDPDGCLSNDTRPDDITGFNAAFSGGSVQPGFFDVFATSLHAAFPNADNLPPEGAGTDGLALETPVGFDPLPAVFNEITRRPTGQDSVVEGITGYWKISASACNGQGNAIKLGSVDGLYLVSECPIQFDSGAEVTNSRIVSLGDISGPSGPSDDGVVFGSVAPGLNGCEADGVQLITNGSINFGAKARVFDVQAYASGAVNLAAQTRWKGSTVIARGDIGLAADNDVQLGCSDGDDDPNEVNLRFIGKVL